MRCFVLSTGRAGSLTVAKAFSLAQNYTVKHESRITVFDHTRLDYPDNHIESDNRLSWFLGSLLQRYPDALYIHLTRDPQKVVASYVRRWEALLAPTSAREVANGVLRLIGRRHDMTIVDAFARGILGQRMPLSHEERVTIATLFVNTVNDNIASALGAARHSLKMSIEEPSGPFEVAWATLGIHGDLTAARALLSQRFNLEKPIAHGDKGL